jgi:hypothetical protein
MIPLRPLLSVEVFYSLKAEPIVLILLEKVSTNMVHSFSNSVQFSMILL